MEYPEMQIKILPKGDAVDKMRKATVAAQALPNPMDERLKRENFLKHCGNFLHKDQSVAKEPCYSCVQDAKLTSWESGEG